MEYRIASSLMAVWGFAQGYYLYQIGASPESNAVGWTICIIALLLALSLLTARNWARLMTLTASTLMLIVYGYFVVRHGAPPLSAWIQPALLVIVVVLLARRPFNKSRKADA